MGTLREYTVELLEEQRKIVEREHPITARGVFYRLVSAGILRNTPKAYQGVTRRISDARWAYLRKKRNLPKGKGPPMYGWEIPFEWIIDESRELSISAGFSSLQEYLDYVSKRYSRNQWLDQPKHVLVGTEKAAMASILRPVIGKWNVPFMPFVGQISDTFCYEIGKRFAKLRDKPIKIIYLGDHDGSGLGIPAAAGRKIKQISQHKDIEWIRVAITEKQFLTMRGQFGIPINPKDPYNDQYPYEDRVELDAMPSDQVRALLEAEIEEHVSMDQWRESKKKELEEQTKLKTLLP